MSSSFGNNLKLSVFGQSHSEKIGVVIDGLPSGKLLDFEAIRRFLERRRSKKDGLTTARSEADAFTILSGAEDGRTCGAPLCAVFENSDTRSADYDNMRVTPRPSHADYAAFMKYKGANDTRGGGHFSGRLTAPLCFAGAVCMEYLHDMNVEIAAHIAKIGHEEDSRFDEVALCDNELKRLLEKKFPVLDDAAGERMRTTIRGAASAGDSVGGSIECGVTGLAVGLGEPMFDGLENRIAQAVFAIPAVKGIEFGAGFEVAKMNGSECNDAFYTENGEVKTRTNNCGGILGGLSSGMPLIFRAAFKPTPSISIEQDSVDLERMCDVRMAVVGRHDPCVVVRAVPCVEAMAAIAIFDLILGDREYGN
ncbi:MAG: chorismate synthase [Oscillospiraceae bacterium]